MLRFTQERWRDARGEPRVRWRGHIRHVQGDRQLRFTEFADAVAFMQRQLAELTAGAVAEDSEPERRKAMVDSFRLWERFATGYTDMMMEAMEATARRSGDYQRQVGDAVARTLDALNPLSGASREGGGKRGERPTGTGAEGGAPEGLRRSVELLRQEIRTLSEKIDRLDASIATVMLLSSMWGG